MAKGIHKGTELANVKETWEENERRAGSDAGREETPAGTDSDLQQVIREEAAEYDGENRSGRVLSGERATLNDDGGDDESGE